VVHSVLILTPVKNAAEYLDGYFERVDGLTYPHERISLALLESDSTDRTYERLQDLAAQNAERFESVAIFKRDFGFNIPAHLTRWETSFQLARRNVLARARNQLLFRALGDQDWVLWLDVDVIDYPHDLIETLLAHDLDILHPDCVQVPGGPSFDHNAWKDDGKLLMQDLRGTGGPVRIDSVGGTVLLVRADIHRDGLIFPPYRYGVESAAIRSCHPLWGKGEIETEGLAAMARDMGLQCWGLPDLAVVHA
jgi:peptide chain release factor subunit 1